jgi:hypothetical protein
MIEKMQPILPGELKPLYVPGMFDQNTTVLWDTVAVYLAYDESPLKIEELPIHVEDDGKLTVSPQEPVIRVATEWRNGGTEAFADHLVDRLARRLGHPRTLGRLYPVTQQPRQTQTY